jgi:hypothetical protein
MTDAVARPRANRRITARLACQLTVRYRASKTWHPATAMDLSPQGCRLRLGEELAGGLALSVVFEMPLRDGSKNLAAEVRGSVTWCRPEGLSYQAGVLFEAPPPELHEVFEALG